MRACQFLLLFLFVLPVFSNASAQIAPGDQPQCSALESRARQVYGRTREARLDQNESRAVQASGQFWEIFRRNSAKCPVMRKMAMELIRVRLPQATPVSIAAREQAPPSESSFGSAESGASKSSDRNDGSGADQPGNQPAPPTAPAQLPADWESKTVGDRQMTRDAARWVIELPANAVRDVVGASRSAGASGSSGVTGSPVWETSGAGQSPRSLFPVPRPVKELN